MDMEISNPITIILKSKQRELISRLKTWIDCEEKSIVKTSLAKSINEVHLKKNLVRLKVLESMQFISKTD